MIEIRGLSVGYQKDRPVLKDLSLEIRPGEIVNILGPNGCGKTTLLKAMLGFLSVSPGSLFLDGRPLRALKRRELARHLAYVPQAHYGVFPYSAREVVLMGRTVHSPKLRFSADDQRLVQQAMEKVKISRLAERSYLELSGGERQLVLIARALAQNCSYVIMDEPVSGLDYGNQLHLLDLVRELAADGPAVVLTTHHPEQAVFLGGRALLLQEGRLLADGPADAVVTRAQVCALYNIKDSSLDRMRAM